MFLSVRSLNHGFNGRARVVLRGDRGIKFSKCTQTVPPRTGTRQIKKQQHCCVGITTVIEMYNKNCDILFWSEVVEITRVANLIYKRGSLLKERVFKGKTIVRIIVLQLHATLEEVRKNNKAFPVLSCAC